MGMIIFVLLLFVLFVKGGQWLGRSVGSSLFKEEKNDGYTYIDRSVHHHYHDNRSVHIDGEKFKNLK